MSQRPAGEEQADLQGTPAPAQSTNVPQSASLVDVFNPKPNTPASHLPLPNVIPVSLRGDFHRVPQIRSTVEREARTACEYLRHPRKPCAISSVSNDSTPSNVDERIPLLPCRRNPPVVRSGIKTEFIPFAITAMAAYRWARRSKGACDSEVCDRVRAIQIRFECFFDYRSDYPSYPIGSRVPVRFPTSAYPHSIRAQRTSSNRREWIKHTRRDTEEPK